MAKRKTIFGYVFVQIKKSLLFSLCSHKSYQEIVSIIKMDVNRGESKNSAFSYENSPPNRTAFLEWKELERF